MRMVGQSMTVLAVAALAGFALAPSADAQFYKGKTITLLFGYSPGGTMDTQTRIIAPFITRHVAGHPDVVVKSMPGAGGMKAQNWLFERGPKDGLTVLHTPTASQSQLLGQTGVRFDYATMTVVGAVNASPMLTYARKDIVPGGLESGADIVKANVTLKQAALRATAWYDMQTRLSLDLLGVKAIFIPGYRGGAKIAAAIRSGEAQIAGAPMAGYMANYKPAMGGPDGIVMPLWYWPFRDEDGKIQDFPSAKADNIPPFVEVYKEVHGMAPSGQKWEALKLLIELRGAVTNVVFMPPGANPEAVAAFREGFARIVKDPEFGPASIKVTGSAMTGVSIAHAERTFKNLSKVDPELVAFLKSYTGMKR